MIGIYDKSSSCFFDSKSRSTFTNQPSKKEKLRLKKRNYNKKKKNLHVLLFLAKEMAVFCARNPKRFAKMAFRGENNNPCRKISRFFCKDCQKCQNVLLASPKEFFLCEEAGDDYHQEGVD